MDSFPAQPIARWNGARYAWESDQTSLFCSEHWELYSETWRTSGMMLNGVAYELPMSEPLIVGSEFSSSLLPSPVARDYKGVPGKNVQMASLPREVSLLPTPASRDWKSCESNVVFDPAERRPLPEVVVNLLPTPSAGNFNDGEDLTSWEARRQKNKSKGINGNGQGTPLSIAVQGLDNQEEDQSRWGKYSKAIERWENILGRPAPDPTEPGRSSPRLSPAFSEFMMGLPEGWVTNVPGLNRKQTLSVIGNGVVPSQAALALRMLLEGE
jgi:DNA (cytosine-5)-methyltransferase 1